jgi:ABC-type Fe3+/spermidine/putrescine transport system ATPase subunit
VQTRVSVGSAFDAWLDTSEDWAPGDAGWLMVRPHRIAVLAPDERRDNTFDAVVQSVAYLGNAFEVSATINGIPMRISAATGDRSPPAAGSQIRLGWNANEARAVRHA